MEPLIIEISKRRLDKTYISRLTTYIKSVAANNHEESSEKVTQLIRFITNINPTFDCELTKGDYQQLRFAELLKHLPPISTWSKYDKKLFYVLSHPAILDQALQDYKEVLLKEILKQPQVNIFRKLHIALEQRYVASEILQITIRHCISALHTRQMELTSVGKYVLKQDFKQAYQCFKQTEALEIYRLFLINCQPKTFDQHLEVFIQEAHQQGSTALVAMMELLLLLDVPRYDEVIQNIFVCIDSPQDVYRAVVVLLKADKERYKELTFEMMELVFEQMREDTPLTYTQAAPENLHHSLWLSLVHCLLEHYGRRALPTVSNYTTNELAKRVQYMELIAIYLKQHGVEILMKALLSKPKKNEVGDHQQYIKQMLGLMQGLYLAKYQHKLWSFFETEDEPETLSLVAKVLAKAESNTLEFVRQKLKASKVNTRFLAMQTLAYINTSEAQQLLEVYLKKERSKRLKEWGNHFLQNAQIPVVDEVDIPVYWFDNFAQKTINLCVKEMVANQGEIEDIITEVKLCYDEQEYRINGVELLFWQGNSLYMNVPKVKSNIPLHVDFIDVQDMTLPTLCEQYRLGVPKELQWGDSNYLIEQLYYLSLIEVALLLPKKLHAKGLKCSKNTVVYLATTDVEDLVEQAWADRYVSAIAKQLTRVFDNEEALEAFAKVCYKSATKQKWLQSLVDFSKDS
jgi:hypothetical protein